MSHIILNLSTFCYLYILNIIWNTPCNGVVEIRLNFKLCLVDRVCKCVTWECGEPIYVFKIFNNIQSTIRKMILNNNSTKSTWQRASSNKKNYYNIFYFNLYLYYRPQSFFSTYYNTIQYVPTTNWFFVNT